MTAPDEDELFAMSHELTDAQRLALDELHDAGLCHDFGGCGEGPDRIDGPGDVYQEPCASCSGTGLGDAGRDALRRTA